MGQISVVIASKVGPPFIDQCLASVAEQAADLGAEVIVVTPRPEEYGDRIRSLFPWVRIVSDPEITKIPALRRRGVEEASGEHVAIIEEHCSAAADWLERDAGGPFERRNFAPSAARSTDYGYDRLRDWVVYFIEYNGALAAGDRRARPTTSTTRTSPIRAVCCWSISTCSTTATGR